MTAASMQTRHARAASSQADEVWREHRRSCSRCDLAIYRRQYDELCQLGATALQIRRDLADRAAKEAAADKAPDPNQGTLFEDGQL